MAQHIISLVVAILLVYVASAKNCTPSEIENVLYEYIDKYAHDPGPARPILPDANCTAHGDVRYITFDGQAFGYPIPVGILGIMVLSWTGLNWWVVTDQEFVGGETNTRVKAVYVRCPGPNIDGVVSPGEEFLAELGYPVVLWRWNVSHSVWSQIGNMAGPFLGGVSVDLTSLRGFKITCPNVPMVLYVYLNTVIIEMGGENCWFRNGVRGICGNYDGDRLNDYAILPPTPLGLDLPEWEPSWKPAPPACTNNT